MRKEAYAKFPEKATADIIQSAPDDVASIEGVFDITQSGAISSSTSHIETAPNGGDVIIRTDAEKDTEGGQASALWSYQGTKVNMKKPFETEMYVYLGNSRFGSADGMSFTFHNDSRGTSAIGAKGGALGVYGDIDEKRKPSKGSTGWGKPDYGDTLDAFTGQAVQKSFSIEMDTAANNPFDSGEGWNGFSKRQHVVASYPSNPEFSGFNKEKFIIFDTGRWGKTKPIKQYGMKETGWFAGTYRPYIYNNAVGQTLFQSTDNSFWQSPYLSDGSWHTLKVQYTPKDRKSNDKNVKVDAPEFKVTFDGKTKDYTGRFSPFQNGLVTEENPYMYWGMTAATGSTAATQAVAFKNIPKTVGIDHESDIKKDGETIVDINADEYTHVKSGDELSYETKSHYATGDKEFDSPVFSETIDENVEVMPGTFEVMEPGSDEFVTVDESDYTIENGQLTYKLKNNLSVVNPDFKTKFQVKVKPTYFEATVSEESKMASPSEFISSSEDLTYIIDPLEVEGEILLDKMTDNPDLTSAVKGTVKINTNYANETVAVKLQGDPKVNEQDSIEVSLNAKGEGTFEMPFSEYLTAENNITATAEHGENGVIAVGKGPVEDKTAPTAEPIPMDYYKLAKEPSDLPFNALQLLDKIADTNPNIETTSGEEPDMTATFLNEKAIKKALTKVGTIDAEIELKDRYENARTIKVPVNVVEGRLIVEAKDSEVLLTAIADRVDDKNQLKDKATLQEIIMESSEIVVSYISENGGKVQLEKEDLEIDDNKFDITGDLLPEAGSYPMTASATYSIYDEGVEKPAKVSASTDFVLTVLDTEGELSIKGEGDLSAVTPITTKVDDISLDNQVEIEVTNTGSSAGDWTLSAKADAFIDSKKDSGFPISLIYFDRESKSEHDLNADQVQIDHSSDEHKTFTFTESDDNNYFKVRTAESSSTWATVNETYETTIQWDLTGSSAFALTLSDQLTEKGR